MVRPRIRKTKKFAAKEQIEALLKSIGRDWSYESLTASLGAQKWHTSWVLCLTVLAKLKEFCSFPGKRFLCLFNQEWVEILIQLLEVPEECIAFFTDNEEKARWAGENYPGVRVFLEVDIIKRLLSPKDRPSRQELQTACLSRQGLLFDDKKFDVILGNPPFETKRKKTKTGKEQRGEALWPFFTELALNKVVEGGFVCLIHKPMWRNPRGDDMQLLYKRLTNLDILYLEMHDDKSGAKTFKLETDPDDVGPPTRWDWYVLVNRPYGGFTTVKDVKGNQHTLNFQEWPWLPNEEFDLIKPLFARGDEIRCPILHSDTIYRHDASHMTKEPSDPNFPHECVHGMNKTGTYYRYSSQWADYFRKPKIIHGNGRYLYLVLDTEGKLGQTEYVYSLVFDSAEEATEAYEILTKGATAEKFRRIIAATKWRDFKTTGYMFVSFKKYWWRLL